ERLNRSGWPPDQPLALDGRKIVAWRPDLDRALVTVHHPVERYPGLAIAQPLEESVALHRGGTENLGDEQKRAHAAPGQGADLVGRNHEDVGLHQHVRAPG